MHLVTMQASGRMTAGFRYETNAGPVTKTMRTKIHALVLSKRISYLDIEITHSFQV
jgi:hypothetical protein